MQNTDFSPALQQLIQALLSLLVVLVGYATFKVARYIQSKQTDTKWALLTTAVEAAVQAIEQMANKGQLPIDPAALKAKAVEMAQQFADSHGIKVDVGMIEMLIESALLKGVHQPVDFTTLGAAPLKTEAIPPSEGNG